MSSNHTPHRRITARFQLPFFKRPRASYSSVTQPSEAFLTFLMYL